MLAEAAVCLNQLNYSLKNLNKEPGTGDEEQEDSSVQQNQQSEAFDELVMQSDTFRDHRRVPSITEMEISDPIQPDHWKHSGEQPPAFSPRRRSRSGTRAS